MHLDRQTFRSRPLDQPGVAKYNSGGGRGLKEAVAVF